ncbi:MAG: permease [Nannocystaceae bacterium]
MARHVWETMLELAPWLLLGAAVAGLLHVLLPQDFVRGHLRGRWGVLKAVCLGVPLPLCSCGVIPTGLGLQKDGASDGAAIGFLISTPQTGVDSILVSASFLGWPFALFKVFSAFVTGFVGGWLADWLTPRKQGPPTPQQAASSPPPALSDTSGKLPSAQARGPTQGFLRGWDHAVELLRMIWGWLVIGVLVSATISTLVPDEALSAVAAHGSLIAALSVVAVSVPLYVCATASVPIAAALVSGGLPLSSALVFLMAGPATNLATIGAIYRGFGKTVTWVYLSTIVIGSVVLGLLFDFVLGPSAQKVLTEHTHHGAISQLAAIALTAAIAHFAFDDLADWIRRRRSTRTTAPTAAPTLTFSVEGMTCNGCARKLEKRLGELDGVESAKVSFVQKHASVTGRATPQRVAKEVREAGYDPSLA